MQKKLTFELNHFLFQFFIIIVIIYSVNVTGKLDGGLDIAGIVTAGLEAELNKLTSDCNKANDLSIEYYATDLPDKNPTNLEDLVKLIQEFPSRLRTINDGLGVPIKVTVFYCFLKEWLVNVLRDLYPRALPEGNKSHNHELKADKRPIFT